MKFFILGLIVALTALVWFFVWMFTPYYDRPPEEAAPGFVIVTRHDLHEAPALLEADDLGSCVRGSGEAKAYELAPRFLRKGQGEVATVQCNTVRIASIEVLEAFFERDLPTASSPRHRALPLDVNSGGMLHLFTPYPGWHDVFLGKRDSNVLLAVYTSGNRWGSERWHEYHTSRSAVFRTVESVERTLALERFPEF